MTRNALNSLGYYLFKALDKLKSLIGNQNELSIEWSQRMVSGEKDKSRYPDLNSLRTTFYRQ